MYTIWYNPAIDELGVLSPGGTFLMEKVNWPLGPGAAYSLTGSHWVKIGEF